MRRAVVSALLAGLSLPAAARPPVPLMPPKAEYAAQDMSSSLAAPEREKPRQVIGLGAELGVVGRRTDTSADVLGMQVFHGGRVFARIPLFDAFYLKPSVGFFRKVESAGASSVTQNVFEGGLTAYYAVLTASRFRWFAGVVQRVELLKSTIAAMGATDAASGWRYRVGPATGLAYGIGPGVSLVLDAEATFAFTAPVRPYAGLTAGFVFYLR